eukprot:3574154-Prorocentrum_lima.AAC.1
MSLACVFSLSKPSTGDVVLHMGFCANPPNHKHHSPVMRGTQPALCPRTALQTGASRSQTHPAYAKHC